MEGYRLNLAIAATLTLAACSNDSINVPANSQATYVARTPAERPRLLSFTAGVTPGFPHNAVAWDLIGAAGGTIWFTDVGRGAIGKLDPVAGKVTEYRNGLAHNAAPYSIVRGPDGKLWFSDAGNGDVGRIDSVGAASEFSSGLPNIFVAQGIVATSNALWAVEVAPGAYAASYLVKVTADGRVTHTRLPASLTANGPIAADRDDNLWFTAWRNLKEVILVERTAGGHLMSFDTGFIGGGEPCCPNVAPKRLLVRLRGSPWFTTQYYSGSSGPSNELAVLRTGGFAFYQLPEGVGPLEPSGIAQDAGTLWVNANDPLRGDGAIYRVEPSRPTKMYSLPTAPAGIAIVTHKIWFTSYFPNAPSQISEVLDL
jgi:streptogramin lyase